MDKDVASYFSVEAAWVWVMYMNGESTICWQVLGEMALVEAWCASAVQKKEGDKYMYIFSCLPICIVNI